MPDPYSLVDGVASPIIPLTFSIDNPAIGELVSNDDLQILRREIKNGTKVNYFPIFLI